MVLKGLKHFNFFQLFHILYFEKINKIVKLLNLFLRIVLNVECSIFVEIIKILYLNEHLFKCLMKFLK